MLIRFLPKMLFKNLGVSRWMKLTFFDFNSKQASFKPKTYVNLIYQKSENQLKQNLAKTKNDQSYLWSELQIII